MQFKTQDKTSKVPAMAWGAWSAYPFTFTALRSKHTAMLYSFISRHRFLKNFTIYAGGATAMHLLHALTFPLWLVYLTPQEFGLLELLYSFQQILFLFANCNLTNVLNLDYLHLTPKKRVELLAEMTVAYGICMVISGTGLLCSAQLLKQFFFHGAGSIPTLLGGAAIGFLLFFRNTIFQLYRHHEKANDFIRLQFIEKASFIVGNIVFLVLLGWQVPGILLSQCLSLLSVISISVYQHRTLLKKIGHFTHIRASNIKTLLVRGFMLWPANGGAFLFNSGDRFILGYYSSLHVVGLYSFAAKFGSLLENLALSPLKMAYQPYIRKSYNKELVATNNDMQKHLGYYLALFCGGISLGYVIGKPLLLWATPVAFHAACPYILYLLLAEVLIYSALFTKTLMIHTKQLTPLMTLLPGAALLNIGLNIILTPPFGIAGCVAATVISSACYALAAFLYNRILITRLASTHHVQPATIAQDTIADDAIPNGPLPQAKTPSLPTNKRDA